MFDLFHGSSGACDGSSRRQFLRIGGLAGLGVSLPGVLRAEAVGRAVPSQKPQAQRDAKSIILLWMQGGPSHIDTFDPKPAAPDEIRGEFNTISTSIPGVRLPEHLPRLARQLDKFSIIRSGYCYNASHGVADAYMMSGWRFTPAVVYPTYGSVVAKELGYRRGMPPFVQLGNSVDRRFNGGVAGYLGHQFNPFEVPEDPNQAKFDIDGISLPSGVSANRFQRRRRMLSALDQWQHEVEKSSDAVAAMDEFYGKAVGMVTSPAAKSAFDLNREHPRVRDEYGRNRFGQRCLLARRLVEAGVRFVTVTDGGWDTHQNNFQALKNSKLPPLDQGYAALIRDLADRGMLENTSVLWMGDFGRTPKVNPAAGRDHWAGSTVFCVGGGGFKTGAVIGQSSDYAEQPVSDPIEVEDLAATMFSNLGIDLERHYTTPDGRPIRIVSHGRVLDVLKS